jgi:hypothetical protein
MDPALRIDGKKVGGNIVLAQAKGESRPGSPLLPHNIKCVVGFEKDIIAIDEYRQLLLAEFQTRVLLESTPIRNEIHCAKGRKRKERPHQLSVGHVERFKTIIRTANSRRITNFMRPQNS